MSSLLDFFKKVVTPENVNCIPDDFTPHTINYNYAKLIRFCKEQNYGFIQLALLDDDITSIRYILSNFKSCIPFELITLPRNNLKISDISKPRETFQQIPLLEWCAEYSYEILIMFLEAGIRLDGIEEVFQSVVAKTMVFNNLTKRVLEKMLQMGVGLNYTLPLLCHWQVTKLVQKYRHRDYCKRAVVYLLGLIKFRKTKYFSGLDPRLLKQMVVTPVWETRFHECWDTFETKKLKI